MEKIFKMFCATINEPREYLREPFLHKGFIYATNGHMAIRISDNGKVQENKDAPKNIHSLFDVVINDFIDIPALPKKVPCEYCDGDGKGRAKEECDECDGNGSFAYRSHTYDCKECDGAGTVYVGSLSADITCEYCIGGWKLWSYMDIGEGRFQCAYIEKILTLQNVKFMRPVNSEDACKFIFDGGEGIIMPMRK